VTHAQVELKGVTKRFGKVAAVDRVDLEIGRGEFFALLGPSGSGKTTLLRLLAGFELPDEGEVRIAGRDVAQVPPYSRPVNMVFQAYALFPHLSVARNVAFGLEMEGVAKAEIAARVAEALAQVELSGFEHRRPDQLSGGQRQRVAIARAIVKRPELLLLDEPLAALDRRLRERTRAELRALQSRLGLTFVMVTHDQDEALALATRIAVLDQGRIAQAGTPAELYERPASRFVAEFLGDCNLLEAAVVAPGVAALAGGTTRLTLDSGAPVGAPLTLAIRPGKIAVGADGRNTLVATVEAVEYLGDLSHLQVRLPDGIALEVSRVNGVGPALAVGDKLMLTIPVEAITVLPA
jgi:putrescine transport system ATP-binding protein